MALACIKHINKSLSYALWHIEEPLSRLAALYPFTEADQKLLESHKVESRKAEWLSARLALRSLMQAHGLENLSIHKDSFGKPHLSEDKAFISISHTQNWGAAVLSTQSAVGIDIEYPRDQIQRIARKFLHPKEAQWTENDLGKLTQVWCAKEALYKLHGRTQLIFAEQLLIESPVGEFPSAGSIRENGSEEKYNLHYDWAEDLLLCLAFSS